MSETKLKLVKSQKKQTLSNGKAADNQSSHTTHQSRRPPNGAPRLTSLPSLTPEERAEAAHFRALTAAKAARQAMLHRIMSELQELDEAQSAA